MKDALRKQMQGNLSLNPFHWEYNQSKLEDAIKRANSADETLDLNTLMYVCNILHENYSAFQSSLKELIPSIARGNESILDVVFVLFNRNFIVSQKWLAEQMGDGRRISFQEVNGLSAQSSDPTIGKVILQDALETDIDALNIACNIIRYQFGYSNSNKENSQPFISKIYEVQKSATIGYILKDIYEDVIWNGGRFEVDLEANSIVMKFDDIDALKARKIGQSRIQTNLLHHYFTFQEQLDNNTEFGRTLSEYLRRDRLDKKLKRTKLINGLLVPEVAKKIDKSAIDREIELQAQLVTFYPFLDVSAVKSDRIPLSLIHVISVFCTIQELVERAKDEHPYTRYVEYDDLHNYPVRISISELLIYLSRRLSYSEKEIHLALRVISGTLEQRVDLWAKPILIHNKICFLALLPIYAPITLKLIDKWLDALNFELDRRGSMFEGYVKQRLASIMRKYGWHHHIVKTATIRNNVACEEVDLILILKNVVVVAELKCTQYATTPREYHNAQRIMSKAATQITRKCNFLQTRLDKDEELHKQIAGKVMIPVVITNFPLFTGYKISSVPIVDFLLLEGYFSRGGLSDGSFQRQNGKTKHHIGQTQYYYNSEDEMNANLIQFLVDPPPVRNLENHFEKSISKFTPEGALINVYCEHYHQVLSNLGEHHDE